MDSEDFERLVARALAEIPDEIRGHIENVDVVVEDWPSATQAAAAGIKDDELLLGLYEGVPLTERAEYGMVLPDKITLFKSAIEAVCTGDEEIVEEVKETVVHEVAHHFGIGDRRLEEMGM